MDGAPQQADEVGASQLTQPPPILTQPSQLAPGRATTAGGATPMGDGATPAGRAAPDAAGSSQAVMATPSLDQLGSWVVRAPDPWTYDRDHTWAGARAVRGRGADTFRCSTMILYKLFPCDYVETIPL
jgi:hypothetical protein